MPSAVQGGRLEREALCYQQRRDVESGQNEFQWSPGQKPEEGEQLEVFQCTLRTLAGAVSVGGGQRQCGSPEGLWACSSGAVAAGGVSLL